MESMTINELKGYGPFYCSSCTGLQFKIHEIGELSCSMCGKKGVSFSGKKPINTQLPIKCEKCFSHMLLWELSDHLKTQCDANLKECKFCSKQYPFYGEKDHLNMCENVSIECPECLAVMNRDHLSVHREHYCSFSPMCAKIECQICKETVNVTTFQTHYERHLYRRLKRC